MFPAAYKKGLATALAGAALASGLAVSGASANYERTQSPDAVPPPPPSSIAASAAEEYAKLRAPNQDSQPVPADETPPSDGFDVLSAAIGAAAGAGVLIVALAAAGLVRRRPLARGQGAVGA
jgi:hypothetical protein